MKRGHQSDKTDAVKRTVLEQKHNFTIPTFYNSSPMTILIKISTSFFICTFVIHWCNNCTIPYQAYLPHHITESPWYNCHGWLSIKKLFPSFSPHWHNITDIVINLDFILHHGNNCTISKFTHQSMGTIMQIKLETRAAKSEAGNADLLFIIHHHNNCKIRHQIFSPRNWHHHANKIKDNK